MGLRYVRKNAEKRGAGNQERSKSLCERKNNFKLLHITTVGYKKRDQHGQNKGMKKEQKERKKRRS